MAILIQCDRLGCESVFDVGTASDWEAAPATVTAFALKETDYNGLIYVYLPEGWQVDPVGNFDHCIHCPDHAGTPSGE